MVTTDPIYGFPSHQDSRLWFLGGLGTPEMDSPGRGACFRTQQLGLGTTKMDSPGRGACSGQKNLDLGLQKWIPPVGAPAQDTKTWIWDSKNGFPRQGRLLRTKSLDLGLQKSEHQPAQPDPSQPDRGGSHHRPQTPPSPPRVTRIRQHNKKTVSLRVEGHINLIVRFRV